MSQSKREQEHNQPFVQKNINNLCLVFLLALLLIGKNMLVQFSF